jgi:UDP-3-O-acyl N-acetylglucosamine deacetylase
MSINRQTIATPTTVAGTGLFTGARSSVVIKPNLESTGIIFEVQGNRFAADINYLSTAPVHPAFASMSARCTSLCSQQSNIATIEHIMSALVGLGVTDAVITTDGPEIPIMDGSSLAFVESIQSSGLSTLGSLVESIRVQSRIEIREAGASIVVEPAKTPSYSYSVDYGEGSPIQAAVVSWDGSPDSYIRRVAHARTFCLKAEADAMHAAGLFTHLTPADMLVLSESGPIDNQLRDPNECAYHKLLDLIGDLALVGRPLIAKVTAHKSGHAMAHKAARAIVDQLT